MLPTQVQNQGITIRKRTPDMLMIVNFFSPDGRYDDIYLSNFATIYVKDELLRVYGVSDINYMGQRDYSIRAWLDPQKLAARNMTAMDVANAIRQQNLDAPSGQIGQLPAAAGAALPVADRHPGPAHRPRSSSATSSSRSARATNREPAPGVVRLRDVARVELGAQNYNQSCTFDGKPSVGLSIYQLPGTNALDVADRVRAKMEELKKRFPDGVDYDIAYDTTPYIRESIGEVFKTLLDAVILVGIVVLVFLQDWRTMILPMIDVPVSLIGTFAVMAALGFSLNNLTLFGLVLAIGIVVDDAIVVLENTERMIAKGLRRPHGDDQGDGGDHRADHGHHAGPELGVRAVLLPERDHGPVLPAVRGDDRGLDDHLGGQRADDDAVAGRADLQEAAGQGGPRPRAEARGAAVVGLRDPGGALERLAVAARPRWPAGPAADPRGAGEGTSSAWLVWLATAAFVPGCWWAGWWAS